MVGMTTPTPPPPAAGPWVEAWLSAPRFAVYLTAASGDRGRALDLYEWNTQLSAALLRDLAHIEVGLRNAYDRALTAWWHGPAHWTLGGPHIFAQLPRRHGSRLVDVNAKPRAALQRAIDSAGGPTAPSGKVLAELMFGFWRYLSSSAHEKTLWVPCLHRAFGPGTDRRTVDRVVGRLHDVRNRVAHHEPLLRTDVAGRLADCTYLATLINADLGQHLAATSRVSQLLTTRP